MLAAVELSDLFEVIGVSLVAGVMITAVFSVVVWSSAKAGEARRENRTGEASAFFVMSTVTLVLFLGAVIVGVVIMLHKS